ncbi:glycosyltransferase family 2 protein [Pediococcus argentinicus]|uniref:Glycosyltransferase n=1 Tax=Pediococcus argentinicus TaxID=480391 RepID=A0A0R2N7Y7_9LACO|nr:glycosyltransferase family 2 protein [Pediococcus argentinicus]KRO21959.1 glycosyltransferase [Pediococcus argentinicus]NKZ23100.1 glycosyltransferase [Pediococcus argentinicus]GEP20241.1 glycosyl transferase [Pediococcus argentinicus]
MKITALVVTYNRLELLQENISNLLKIKEAELIQNIVVVDNHSDQDTQEFLESTPEIEYVRLDKNIGGAGGFNAGMKYFYTNTNDDAVWVMDDDTIPSISTITELRIAATNHSKFGFLLSNVVWTDNTPCKMNIPWPDIVNWTSNILETDPLVPLLSGSFVSMLISRTAIEKVGYPISEFFVWGDDSNYSQRVSSQMKCYFVPKSVVVHKMKQNIGTEIVYDDVSRIPRYFYAFRNNFYSAKKRSGKEGMKFFLHIFSEIAKVLKNSDSFKMKRIFTILKGSVAGMFFNPNIEYVKKD